MKYEDILRDIGGFNKYQIRVLILLFLSFSPNGFFTMVSVFVLDLPDYHCKIPTKNATNYSAALNESILAVKNESDHVMSQCPKYQSNESSTLALNRSAIACDEGWEYFPEYGEETAVTEWDLVCVRAWIKPFIISCYMAGTAVGGIVGGGLSDRFGRRPVFLIGFAMQFASTFFAGFSTGPYVLATFYFLVGITVPITYVGGFVLGSELVVSSKRAWLGLIASSGFAVGYMLLPAFAYFLVDWRWLMFCIGGIGILYIPYYWLIPESPRWLIMNGKPQAEALIKNIAKVNGRNIDNLDLSALKSCQEEETEAREISKQFSYIDLFKIAVTRTRTLILCVLWFSSALTYYGISFRTSDLGGNKFINCFFSAAVEIPSNVIICILIYKFGRRNMLAPYYVSAGICCVLSTYFRPVNETLMIVLAMVGKFCTTGCFTGIYIYSCELFPTKMRQMGMGAVFSFGRFGSITAPYLIYAGERVLVISICIAAILSGLLILLLPETVHSKIPETLDDVIKQERYKLRLCRRRKEDDILKMKK